MIQTDFGTFDGTSWERLCQSAFKLKYGPSYQRMPASPGDYGIEGWTTDGLAFQCYCPERHYTQDELYDAIRDKITRDVGKLKSYAQQIAERIGSTKIRNWLFVTPTINDNELHKHARKKERDARKWALTILTDDFNISLLDAGYYSSEFEQCRRNAGNALQLGPAVDKSIALPEAPEEYDKLIARKNRMRLKSRLASPTFEAELSEFNKLVQGKFLRCDHHLATIERTSPQAFAQVIRVIGLYADEMQELKYFWTGEPNELVESVKAELGNRLEKELGGIVSFSDARTLADLVVARWLAVCQLDFSEPVQ
ncbi:hypothetical protein AB4Y45_22890 [Paraburkholderia sp. EG287A]|uniref:hypothetical protein n=1 Tax=Paraburkholderia sp. EG287A TaxID=3237012 RepID=UPI0034D2B80A